MNKDEFTLFIIQQSESQIKLQFNFIQQCCDKIESRLRVPKVLNKNTKYFKQAETGTLI